MSKSLITFDENLGRASVPPNYPYWPETQELKLINTKPLADTPAPANLLTFPDYAVGLSTPVEQMYYTTTYALEFFYDRLNQTVSVIRAPEYIELFNQHIFQEFGLLKETLLVVARCNPYICGFVWDFGILKGTDFPAVGILHGDLWSPTSLNKASSGIQYLPCD